MHRCNVYVSVDRHSLAHRCPNVVSSQKYISYISLWVSFVDIFVDKFFGAFIILLCVGKQVLTAKFAGTSSRSVQPDYTES